MDYEILVRFLIAALWGGLVGAEREYRSKSAGFRTMIMISIGSCFFTIMSIAIGAPGNPDRIASNIVTGIGFLGAGVIFRGTNQINGITTAATIWAVAAVGMGIGAGYYFASACASILIFIVLALLPYLQTLIDNINQSKTYSVSCKFTRQTLHEFEESLTAHNLKYTLINQSRDNDEIKATWHVQGYSSNHRKFIDLMIDNNKLLHFSYR